MSARSGASFSAGRIAARVAALGREITRECDGRRLDVVVTLDRGFVFAADLIRQIAAPVVCHFVREDVRDVEHAGLARREVFFRFAAGIEKPRRVARGCSARERRYSGVSVAASRREPAPVDSPGRAARQTGAAPGWPGARLLWLPDCI